jgi:hypothetical protein
LILPADFPTPVRDGGREHDVRYEPETGLWWKYTKPNLAGYTISWSGGEPYMHNALPSEYLERMLRMNAIFGDDVQLIGLWNPSGHDWRIITSQPHVIGEAATLEQLGAAFEAVGFEILPWRGIGYASSLAVRKDGIDVWDIHPANVLISDTGLPMPFDVMLTLSPST